MSDAAQRIRILCVDDHPIVRQGIAGLIAVQPDMTLVAEASNGREAIQQFRAHRPDVTLMDLQMPEMGGLDAIGAIRGEFPDARIIVLTTYAGDAAALRAMQAGARGYLLKNALEVDLPYAIKEVAAGREVLAPGLTRPGTERPEDSDFGKLTQREREVLQYIVQGKSNKQIAAMLGLSVNTVSVHRANLMSALGIHRTADLVVYALRKGLVTMPEPGEG